MRAAVFECSPFNYIILCLTVIDLRFTIYLLQRNREKTSRGGAEGTEFHGEKR